MSTPCLRAALLVAALLPAPWAVAAPPSPLSLEQALALAVQRSQATVAARAGAGSAAELARAAGQLPDPMLSLAVDNLPATGARRYSPVAEEMTMKRIALSQEWVAADKRAAREAVAGAAQRREATQEGLAAAETRLQTALAYIDAYYAGEALQLALRNEQNAREELAAGQARLASPAGSGAEALGLAGALGMAEDDAAELRQQQAAAAAGLQRWTGTPAEALTAPALAATPAPEAYVAGHPQVLARQRDTEVARQEAELARLNRRPNWSYELSYGQRSGRPDLVSLGVSLPLPVAPAARQDRETAARLAMADKAAAETEEARRAALGEYLVLRGDAQRLQARIERLQAAVLVPLRQRTAATLAAYRANQAGLVMLFDARRAELEAQRKLLNLQRELARAQAQLVFKTISDGAQP